MRYLSLCSGIEAATVAWRSLGWQAVGFAEIEPFPCAVLAHHYPDVKNYGDFTKIDTEKLPPVDLVVAGTPCQDFSIAGRRAGMDGNRGSLTWQFARLVGKLRPQWLVWENVPGILSIDSGRGFGAFIGRLAKLGYGVAYRILDAQYFGVPQRRRRVFVVGYFGDWRCAAAVLFERHSLSGHPAPGREERSEVAGTFTSCAYDGGIGCRPDLAASGLVQVTQALTGRLGCGGQNRSMVRRLAPRECERLQGFPDDYTAITYRNKPGADGPRYKALGNSMAVPVMRWIGERIRIVEEMK
ncbi:MAG: DNA (cytosine-5-)-methyltransferase [Desulfobulbaceae bacterium]|jgi:DNA (cytosine-5)-methyltransferase 1|nr:DNA (cytosine-5-)-methyltransferase [Desulfobulbaceae bacterium]